MNGNKEPYISKKTGLSPLENIMVLSIAEVEELRQLLIGETDTEGNAQFREDDEYIEIIMGTIAKKHMAVYKRVLGLAYRIKLAIKVTQYVCNNLEQYIGEKDGFRFSLRNLVLDVIPF